MKLCLTAICAAVIAAAVPAAASAATLTVDPAKPCFRSGESATLSGTGYTPNVLDGVNVTRDGAAFGSLSTDPLGNIVGELQLGENSGRRTSTYVATDVTNPALVASLQLTVSAVEVNVRPRGGRPGRRVKIGATGFTTGKNLWVHVRKGGFKRDFKIGRLTGACKRLTAKKRVLPPNAATGLYRVQFDTFRRYKPRREVAARFTITVSRTFRPSAAASASTASTATSWTRGF
jgi:hypothetical protein